MGKIEEVKHEKMIGVCCYHSLIPTPLSVWRTDLIDSGDALYQFANSSTNLVLSATPSISFNVKIEDSVFCNGGNLEGTHFNPAIMEVTVHRDGLIQFTEHDLKLKESNITGIFKTSIPI